MAAYFAVSLLLHVEMYGLIVCVWLIETGIHRLMPADIIKIDIAWSVLFSPYFIAGIVLLVIVEMLVGTTIMRFGKKAGIFWWALWMTACIVPSVCSSGQGGNTADTGTYRHGNGGYLAVHDSLCTACGSSYMAYRVQAAGDTILKFIGKVS